MKKIIHNLRKQPEEVRRHLLHVSMFVSAILLVLIWLFSFGTNLANSSKNTAANSSANQDLKPLSVLKDNIVNGISSFSGSGSSQSTQQ